MGGGCWGARARGAGGHGAWGRRGLLPEGPGAGNGALHASPSPVSWGPLRSLAAPFRFSQARPGASSVGLVAGEVWGMGVAIR